MRCKTGSDTSNGALSSSYFYAGYELSGEGCDCSRQDLSKEEDEHLVIYGFKRNSLKIYMTFILHLLTLGISILIFYWYPKWKLHATHTRCCFDQAEEVLVLDQYKKKYKSYYVEKVRVVSSSDFRELQDTPSSGNTIKLNAYLGDGNDKEFSHLRILQCKKLFYVWDAENKSFQPLTGLDKGKRCADFHNFRGLSETEQALRRVAYGKNEIEVPVATILSLLVLEALTPFYIFQVFSLIVWFAELYYYYTVAIVIMSVFGITSSVAQTRKNQRSLQDSIHMAQNVTVSRGNGVFEEIPSSKLVPGDVIQIPKEGCTLECDAVLLNGTCIVNESMLTGESVPITKTPMPKTNGLYDIKEDAFHTLFSGTHVIQTRSQDDKILAVVIRTGFLTSKGQLVRSILYPPPSDFKFDQDTYKFIGILTAIALVGCVYTIASKSSRSIAFTDILIKALDLITIVVPPALPAAMTMGKLHALRRLKKSDIYCMNSRVINVSGSIDCVCFDKTGTLTEDGLDMWAVVTVDDGKLREPVKDAALIPKTSAIIRCMASCHSLTVIDGRLLGDPLDVKIFESTAWLLEEGSEDINKITESNIVKPLKQPRRVSSISCNGFHNNETYQIEIVRQYQFSSTLQRMSVITKSDVGLEVHCKGSPEMIISLSNSHSVPANIQSQLKKFTAEGYRVIALAARSLNENDDVQRLERSAVESELNFLGLVIFENKMKAATPATIRTLKRAKIKTVMITGDNVQTALSVAKECGIVENGEMVVNVEVSFAESPTLGFSIANNSDVLPTATSGEEKHSNETDVEKFPNFKYCYAMTGTIWAFVKRHFPEKIPELVTKGAVFARMSGQQKQQLIQELQQLGYYVAMCGDGANDCGALKAANVGISLSDEESSVAAPFTSKNPDISCVTKVIGEGRAALITSIGIFKFMVCYSLTQFISVLILYGIDSNLTSFQFLFIDICLILHFTVFFGKTEAHKGALTSRRPPTSLLSITAIASILLQIALVVAFQIAAFKLIQTYEWFRPFAFDPEKSTYYVCYENYAVFSVSTFQYIIMVVAFSKGDPYRRPIYTNYAFLFSSTMMTVVCVYIILYPAEWIVALLEILLPPKPDAGVAILGLAIFNFVCGLIVEDVLVEYILNNKVVPKIKGAFKPKSLYLGDLQSLNLHRNDESVLVINENKAKGILNPAFYSYEVTSEAITKL